MRIDVFTILPGYFEGPLSASLLGRARARGVIDVRIHDVREWSEDRHRSVDDAPFGGGAGMVLMAGPLFAAVEGVEPSRPLLLLSASGEPFDDRRARELARGAGFSLVCGRYEGVDQRVAENLCDGEVSIGDYVLGGGEPAALVVVEAVARLVPEVLGNANSTEEESFSGGLLEHPQYTRPATFRGWAVPDILLSGDHRAIAAWRRGEALRRTRDRRPDLLERRGLSDEERGMLEGAPG